MIENREQRFNLLTIKDLKDLVKMLVFMISFLRINLIIFTNKMNNICK